MDKKIFTVAILGAGARGARAYGRLINERKEKFNIVSLCDVSRESLLAYGEEFGVSEDARFTDEEEFFEKKRADLLIIATQDLDHVRHAERAFSLGYDVLLEKPISADRGECERLVSLARECGSRVIICYILRYAPIYAKVKEMIDGGEIGGLTHIDWVEPVGYEHYTHSFVRGNWRNTDVAHPMILAKCSHDLDYIKWCAGDDCLSVSSRGDLSYFKSENKPEESPGRCSLCPRQTYCDFSAYSTYLGGWKRDGSPEDKKPYNVLTPAPVTEEGLVDAIENGPYGRCVFACDNNVVDRQTVDMEFKNSVRASLRMTAFESGDRFGIFTGDEGTIRLENDVITLKGRDGAVRIIKESDICDTHGYAHGGGDYFLIESLYGVLTGDTAPTSSLEESVESHLIGIAAEESRAKGGEWVFVHK